MSHLLSTLASGWHWPLEYRHHVLPSLSPQVYMHCELHLTPPLSRPTTFILFLLVSDLSQYMMCVDNEQARLLGEMSRQEQ